MKEQLVTFETAKLAKEKRFNIECLYFYCKNNTCNYLKEPYKYSFNVDANQNKKDNFGYGQTWSAPTQSLLQKWLREVHKINVYCLPTEIDESKWYHNIASSFKVYIGSYEEVLEQGLQEGLKLIINK